MTESVETRIAYALETTLNALVYRDGFGTEDIVVGLLAVVRRAAATGMSLQDLRDCVEDMMDEAALGYSQDGEDAE
jgi:hypothetical protein